MTREQVLESLRHLQDPVYGISMVELNAIKDVMVKENSVAMSVVLSTDDEGRKEELRREIAGVLNRSGIADVHIRFREMSDYERAEAAKKANPEPVKPTPTNLLAEGSKTTFIAVASGKGGVGKSTVAVNLAVALARKGKRVGIIDADIYGFSVPDMMGIEDRPELVDQLIRPVERYGVKVISMGFFVQDNAPVIWRGPMLGKMLRNFFSEVEWGELDYMVLDLPPGTGDVALDVHQMIPHSKEIIVTTPHATAAFVAARAGAMAVHTNHEIIGVVENMAYYACGQCGHKDYVFGRGGGAKLAEELHTKLLAQIPLGAPDNHPSEPDYSPSVYKADSDVGQMYLEVAEAVIRQNETEA
ncbi:Mrp/NBP35 family ATP-binding protein [Paenibacillus flagellatus]|uniref:Iron-sulfur cluster carrier protein n=1 Tax=Paenibacillus flagellatus TaxID=2211139 RepID=A0A2V5JXY6_9BACL|nr:Mrp/NBP35 family ATP-binding protein [Paenibacillus flagellatus]PYI50104.1 MRP family ATP-binding protein [Paenibacillus flagellatus]